MINEIKIKNFGPTYSLEWNDVGAINVIAGKAGVGKNFLMKCIYTAIRTLELFERGREFRTAEEILLDKLFWTFECGLYDLNQTGSTFKSSFEMKTNNKNFNYFMDPSSLSRPIVLNNTVNPRKENSFFIPLKEVISIHQTIKTLRDDRLFGFDDTYVDLARSICVSPPKSFSTLNEKFEKEREALQSIIGGKFVYRSDVNKFEFKTTNQNTIPLNLIPDVFKKIASIDLLLGNLCINSGSIVFIDNIGSSLDSWALRKFMSVIVSLSKNHDIQFFISSARPSSISLFDSSVLSVGVKWEIQEKR